MSTAEDHVPGQYIPLHYHFQMLLDRARVRGFREALARRVPQGGRVLELGGGTGVLSYFAAQRATKVWCVERNAEVASAAERFLARNGVADRVEVICADALTYLPPEPVDVVVCEMLHVGLLREKQIEVIASFKERYGKKFGGLPLFVPEATILAVQPVHYDFDFAGYEAPVSLFFDPLGPQEGVTELGGPLLYGTLLYDESLPFAFNYRGTSRMVRAGTVNALRFITKNLLAILVEGRRTIDWHNQYLVLPVPEPARVEAGQNLEIRFAYRAGGSIESLTGAIEIVPGEFSEVAPVPGTGGGDCNAIGPDGPLVSHCGAVANHVPARARASAANTVTSLPQVSVI